MTTNIIPELEPRAANSKFVHLHELTFPQVTTSKVPVVCTEGYLWGGPDRRGATAPNPNACFMKWQREVQKAEKTGKVPPHVMAYFQKTKALGRAPRGDETENEAGLLLEADRYTTATDCSEADIIQRGKDLDLLVEEGELTTTTKKKLANPPRFATSYSGMKDFLNCPAKWAAAKYYKTLPYIEGPEAKWGNEVHAAFERAIGTIIGYKGAKATATDIATIKDNGWSQFLKSIVTAHKAGAMVEVERELCFTKDLNLCGWKDWNTVWFRFKGDVHIRKEHKFVYMDWKTGKRFSKRGDDQADTFQLEVAWAVVSLYHPEVEEFTGVLVFLQEKDDLTRAIVKRSFTRLDLPAIWEKIFDVTRRMEQAWETENFRMQTSGLCRKHCGNTSCPHCGG